MLFFNFLGKFRQAAFLDPKGRRKVFKTGAFNRSATPPRGRGEIVFGRGKWVKLLVKLLLAQKINPKEL
jgi:hypothetical protein